MDYRIASNIRGKSLSSLITDRITSGGSVGSSIKGAISDKLKAKGTGIKEKFDPMNIARAMTGGGKLAPAILGRITGRSQSDINYFAGDKNKSSSYTKMPSVGQVPSEGFGGSAIEVLNKMLSFMQKNREDDLKRKQISMSFEEEKQSEEQRRHDQFLKVLKDYTSLSGGTTTIVKKEEGEGFLSGLMDTIKSMISTAVSGVLTVVNGLIDGFKKSLEWLGDLKILMSTLGGNAATKLLSLGRFLLNPFTIGLFAAIAGGAAIMWLGEKLKDYFRENVADMKIIGPTEAANILLNGNQKAIDKFPGGEKALRDIIENAPKRATEILARGDNAEILAAGGVDKLREIEKDIIAQPAKRDAMQDMAPFVAPRAIYAGNGSAKKSKEQFWDREFGPYYDPETGKRLNLLNSSTAGAGRGSVESAATDPRRLDLQTPTTTPIPEMPASSAVVGKIQENNDLNMQSTLTAGGSSAPSVSVNSSSTSVPDQTVTSTATTRDDTPILDLVLKRAKAQV
jgi:hypothetical protein